MKQNISLTGRLIGSILTIIFLTCCHTSRQAAIRNYRLPLISKNEFYSSGLAELKGSFITKDQKNRFFGSVGRVYYDNIVTGEHGIRGLIADSVSPEEIKVKGWVRVPSPRIFMLRDINDTFYPVYLQAGNNLEFILKDGKRIYGGSLGKVNQDLTAAPQFLLPDSLSGVLDSNPDMRWAEVMKAYEAGERVWKDELDTYLKQGDLSEVARKILEVIPAYTKAKWVLVNEKRMLADSAADYSSLKEFLEIDNLYQMAGNGSGAMPKLIAGSELLRGLAGDRGDGYGNIPEAVAAYLERYNNLLLKLGIVGMPDPLQLAISQTLCDGGVLKRSGSKTAALEILDRVAPDYLPNKEIEREVREYVDRIFHDEYRNIPDTPEGEILRRLIEPYKGRNVILDFWGYQCPPCLKGMEKTRAIREKYRGNPDWVVLYVTDIVTTPKREYEKIREKFLPGDESVLLSLDEGAQLGALFDLHVIPRQILIDRDGIIRDSDYSFEYGAEGEWINMPDRQVGSENGGDESDK